MLTSEEIKDHVARLVHELNSADPDATKVAHNAVALVQDFLVKVTEIHHNLDAIEDKLYYINLHVQMQANKGQ